MPRFDGWRGGVTRWNNGRPGAAGCAGALGCLYPSRFFTSPSLPSSSLQRHRQGRYLHHLSRYQSHVSRMFFSIFKLIGHCRRILRIIFWSALRSILSSSAPHGEETLGSSFLRFWASMCRGFWVLVLVWNLLRVLDQPPVKLCFRHAWFRAHLPPWRKKP